jgi:hypothetical protein
VQISSGGFVRLLEQRKSAAFFTRHLELAGQAKGSGV